MADNTIINATYVSVWDGNTEIRSSCKFNAETKEASDIEQVDGEELEDLDFLEKEYVEFSSGEIVETFTTECGRKVVKGELDESLDD